MLLVLPVSTLVPEIPPDVLGSSMDMLDDWCSSSLSGCCGELKVKWTETDYSHNNDDEFKDDMCTVENVIIIAQYATVHNCPSALQMENKTS